MTLLKSPLTIIVLTQLVFTAGDLLARAHLRHHGLTLSALLQWWFLAFLVLRHIGMLGQLYVFANLELGKMIALFNAVAIVLSNVVGLLFLKEVLSPSSYLGVVLSLLAVVVLTLL
jgi:multidrug transporter EmrE-like cation transporter